MFYFVQATVLHFQIVSGGGNFYLLFFIIEDFLQHFSLTVAYIDKWMREIDSAASRTYILIDHVPLFVAYEK